ncbi:MAG: hypothetical protein HOO88_07485 [Kiritimatiellaceae bacterium]|nr:hypothetical protein [Kiritimatiellaceae bacterium]
MKYTVRAEIEVEITADDKGIAQNYFQNEIENRMKTAGEDGTPPLKNPHSINVKFSNKKIKEDGVLSSGFKDFGN